MTLNIESILGIVKKGADLYTKHKTLIDKGADLIGSAHTTYQNNRHNIKENVDPRYHKYLLRNPRENYPHAELYVPNHEKQASKEYITSKPNNTFKEMSSELDDKLYGVNTLRRHRTRENTPRPLRTQRDRHALENRSVQRHQRLRSQIV